MKKFIFPCGACLAIWLQLHDNHEKELSSESPFFSAQRRKSRSRTNRATAPIAIAATGFSFTKVDTVSRASP